MAAEQTKAELPNSRELILQWLLADHRAAHEQFLSVRSGTYQIIVLTTGFGSATVAGGAFVWDSGLPAVLIFNLVVPMAIFGGTLGALLRVNQQIAFQKYLSSIESMVKKLLGPEQGFGFYSLLESEQFARRYVSRFQSILLGALTLGAAMLSTVIGEIRVFTPYKQGEMFEMFPEPWIWLLAGTGLFHVALAVALLAFWIYSGHKRSQQSAVSGEFSA